MKEGKQAGSVCFYTFLRAWSDADRVLHLSLPTRSELEKPRDSHADLVDFSKPGTLHVVFLSKKKPVWTTVVKWPGQN